MPSPISLSRFLLDQQWQKQARSGEPPVRRYVEELVAGRGGAATTGRGRILEVVPTSLHQRVPVIPGSRNEVQRVTACHA